MDQMNKNKQRNKSNCNIEKIGFLQLLYVKEQCGAYEKTKSRMMSKTEKREKSIKGGLTWYFILDDVFFLISFCFVLLCEPFNYSILVALNSIKAYTWISVFFFNLLTDTNSIKVFSTSLVPWFATWNSVICIHWRVRMRTFTDIQWVNKFIFQVYQTDMNLYLWFSNSVSCCSNDQ